ncbi:MAG TPA: hypothetical protein VL595_15450, partial [Pseudonocardia sp.]|nr:hypothetical protein [Pseudonocardia sp.]
DGADTSSGAMSARVEQAKIETASARERLELAESALRAWGHDPEHVAALYREWFDASVKVRPRLVGGAPIGLEASDSHKISVGPPTSSKPYVIKVEADSRKQVIGFGPSAVPYVVEIKRWNKSRETYETYKVSPTASEKFVEVRSSSKKQIVRIVPQPPASPWAAESLDLSKITAPGYKVRWRDDPKWYRKSHNLYRWDNREPSEIFETGFRTKQPDTMNLSSYTKHNTPSAFVSTSKVRPGQGKFDWPAKWIYIISAPGGIDVNASKGTHGFHSTLARPGYEWQQEITFPGGVRPRYIVGAYLKGYQDKFVRNPRFENLK